jgi:hypothetical protein
MTHDHVYNNEKVEVFGTKRKGINRTANISSGYLFLRDIQPIRI